MSERQRVASRFHDLHAQGCFVMPNPYDVGSAIALERMGFSALATTSAGFAWTTGVPDRAIDIEPVLEHLAQIAGAVDLPVNADFEGGYAVEPEGVATNVERAAATGIAGLSIEDSSGNRDRPLHDLDLAVERIRAARAAIDEGDSGIVLTARCESFVVGLDDLDDTVRRLQAYAEAGADCLYAPCLTDVEQVRAIVQGVAPKPVNLLINAPFTTVAEAAEIGVRRISVGGHLAKVAWKAFLAAAHEIAEAGTFGAFRDLPDVNAILDVSHP